MKPVAKTWLFRSDGEDVHAGENRSDVGSAAYVGHAKGVGANAVSELTSPDETCRENLAIPIGRRGCPRRRKPLRCGLRRLCWSCEGRGCECGERAHESR